jgi:subtilase family serine protease
LVWDTSESYIEDPDDNEITPVAWHDGTFACESQEKPDLEIVEKGEEWVNETHYTVSYVIHNNGTAIAPACHNTTLYVDGVAIEHKHVPVALAYCETYTDTFDTTIECTGDVDIIRVCAVCADNYNVIDELDETNNCLENEWICKEAKPDLTVTEITVNYDASSLGGRAIGPEPGPGVHTECNNLSAVIEEENGVDVLASFDVTFEVDGATLCTVRSRLDRRS